MQPAGLAVPFSARLRKDYGGRDNERACDRKFLAFAFGPCRMKSLNVARVFLAVRGISRIERAWSDYTPRIERFDFYLYGKPIVAGLFYGWVLFFFF